jgi:hypothetical protein
MFYPPRQQLLKTLKEMQRKQCCYIGHPCDCKYGATDMLEGHWGGEQTGCPELSCCIQILTLLTDKQYEKLMKKYIDLGLLQKVFHPQRKKHE